MLGELCGCHRQVAVVQLAEHEVGTRRIAVVEFAHHDAAPLIGCGADGNLKGNDIVAHHQMTQEFERIRLRDDVEAQIAAAQRFVEQLTSAEFGFGQRHRIARAVAQPDRGLGGERMPGRQYRDQPLLERHQRTEIRQIGRAEYQREIDLVIGKALHRLDVILHHHLEMHERKPRAVGCDLARQEFQYQRLAGGNAHGAAAQPLQILDLRTHPVEVGGLAADMMDEQFTGRGQPHAARAPLEQRRLQFGLQVHNAPVDGGRGYIEPFGGLADRSGPRHGIEIMQKTQVSHRLEPCRRPRRHLIDAETAALQQEISGRSYH